MKTKIFLDSGDPKITKKYLKKLGFLDGQTTNPSLFSKSPSVIKAINEGKCFTKQEIYEEYKKIILGIRKELPKKSISVEVYADKNTSVKEMVNQALEMNTWINGAHIKLPTTKKGLQAAQILVKQGINVNMTLVFTQEQAAAVHAATLGAKKGQVFLSPFIGRLDDLHVDGMSLITDIQKLYKKGDGHVQILAASIRSIGHLLELISLKVNIITIPPKIIDEWIRLGKPVPKDFDYDDYGLKDIEYKNLSLNKNIKDYNIKHKLLTKGLQQFANDWNKLLCE